MYNCISDLLSKGYLGAPADILGELAGEHAAVRPVHLLRNVFEYVGAPAARVKLALKKKECYKKTLTKSRLFYL